MWLALLTNKKFADTKGRSNKLTTTTSPAPKLAGKALYLELIPNPALSDDEKRSACGWEFDSATRQIILFPEYQDDTGKILPAIMYSRSVTEYSPRAQWDSERVTLDKPKPLSEQPEEKTSYGAYGNYVYLESYSRDEWNELTPQQQAESKSLAMALAVKSKLFSSVSRESGAEGVLAWVIRDDKPIVVELTNLDYEDLEKHKTPQAVVRRINKVRDSIASFPKKIPTKRTSV